MTGSGRQLSWRRRALALALAFVTSLVFVPVAWLDAAADETTSFTMMYHGSVGGKIAPCG